MKQGKDSAWSKSQGRSSRVRCYICQSKEHLKRDYPRYNHKKSQRFVRNEDQVSSFGADRYDTADVMMAMSVEELLDWIMDSGSSLISTDKSKITRLQSKTSKHGHENQKSTKLKPKPKSLAKILL
ncbi:hypothetical protein Tco_0062889 [Tanacetum coccineum]